MKSKIILAMFYFALNTLAVNATTNKSGIYNWGADEETSKGKWMFLENSLDVKDYKKAVMPLHWLLKNTPDLNVALYIYGSKILEGNVDSEKDATRKTALQDSALWIYDQRIKLYNEEDKVLNIKGKVAFKYLYGRKNSEMILFNLYEKIYELNKDKMYVQNASNYFKSAIVLYRQKKIEKKKIILVYSEMVSFLDRKYNSYAGNERNQRLTERTSKSLSKLFSANLKLDCAEINTYFQEDYTKNPTLEKARFVNAILLKNKCLDNNLFIETNNKLLETEPSATRFSVAAKLYLHHNNLVKATECFTKALNLETNDSIKSDIQLQLAKISANDGSYANSKLITQKAIQLNSNNLKAYEFMGDLYLLGANQCKSADILVQKSVYIAAYNMYKKGNNSNKMASARNQFPTMEEIFVQNKKEGDTVKLNCWINENVALIKK